MTYADEQIQTDIVNRLHGDARIEASGIFVDVKDGAVTLTGTVCTYSAKKVAQAVASLTKGVVCLDNRLFVLFRPSNNVPTDTDIKHNAQKALSWFADINTSSIEINVARGGITLKGTVPSFWHRNKVEDLISNLHDVIDVKNVLAVVPTEKIDDEIIAENIVNELDRSAFLNADKVEVRVMHGVVTLSGEVNSAYARWRTEMVIENTLGVQDLINQVTVKYV